MSHRPCESASFQPMAWVYSLADESATARCKDYQMVDLAEQSGPFTRDHSEAPSHFSCSLVHAAFTPSAMMNT